MSTPKENLTELQQSAFIKVLMPERKGYGYEKENPIEVPSPYEQIEFIRSALPDYEGITNAHLIEGVRTGSLDAKGRLGLIDEYELAYAYTKNGQPYAELFVIYFSFYPKEGESQMDFLYRVTHNSIKYPEGLKNIKK